MQVVQYDDLQIYEQLGKLVRHEEVRVTQIHQKGGHLIHIDAVTTLHQDQDQLLPHILQFLSMGLAVLGEDPDIYILAIIPQTWQEFDEKLGPRHLLHDLLEGEELQQVLQVVGLVWMQHGYRLKQL